NGQDMLFDIVKDPDERWNVIARYREIARKLRGALEKKLMSMEQRYFMDLFKPGNIKSHPPLVLRRLQAWGLYQTGVVPPWDPQKQVEWDKQFRPKK
ncbi:MAG: hypothetical protein NTW86_26170, partial [Candidatus Sumerlaeota bacterium]|nr:hypothetical protein [Candidatus Sumerlaeota bacterium]